MKLKFLFFGLLFSMISFAQNSAKVSGIITDKDSKQPVSFVSISLKGLMTNAESDINGNYEITMKPGTYTIVYAFIGYKTFEKEVTVTDNETLNLNIALQENSNSIEGIVITGSTKKTSETALIKEQQKAVEMKQSIGSQEMERKGVSNVESGLAKVTGITKAESRGLFVRGLEDRYNNLLINDLQVPSNSPFKKIIPLSLFPTDIVGVLSVYKTFNPNLPGDFAGATINVETSEPQASQTKLSVGFGFITQNNGGDFLISESANNDQGFFGIQKSKRELPSAYGKIGNYTLSSTEYLNSYKNSTWNVDKVSAPINNSISFSHSDKFKFDKGRSFSYLLSLNWDNKYQVREGVDRTFIEAGTEYNNNLRSTTYKYLTNTSALVSLKYKSDRFSVATNSMYIRSTESMIQDQIGVLSNQQSNPNRLIRTNQFEQSDYFNNQLVSSYKLTSDNKHSIKGGISYVKTIFELPDTKFLVGDLNNGVFTNTYGGSTLNRQNLSIKGNYYMSGFGEYNLNFGKEINGKTNKLSIGFNSFKNSLSSTYRLFASNPINGGIQNNTNINDINSQILSDIENGLIAEREESNAEYKTKLNQFVNSGYANAFFNLSEKLEINGGIRMESSDRILKYRKLSEGDITTDPYRKEQVKKNYFLPSVNSKYKLNEKSNLRFAASQTITRPVLMELLPIQIVNPNGKVTLGNKDLKDTQNLNIDVKYEYFSDKKDLLAVGVYAKNIKDPIERVFIPSATLLTTYQNSKVANLYGAEFETILNLSNLSDKLDNFSVGFNGAFMQTKVEVSDKNKLENNSTRALQGASNWVINSDIKYDFKIGKDIKNTATLVYGVKGKNIYSVGSAGVDHIYEMPFHKLDLVYSSKFTKNLSAKFTIDNILNPTQKLELGNNSATPIIENSLVVEDYKKGVGFALSLSYTF
jgi:outer membrane receptor protein involved in Fe transport